MSTTFWQDHEGKRWPIVRPGKLKMGDRSGIESHRALRRFVFFRDNYTCCRCGAVGERYPDSGFVFIAGPAFQLEVDHIVARVRGGTNHPDNLQALCGTCNASKGKRSWL